MANLQKYTMGAAGHMFAHYGRQQGEAVERSNKSIDDSRTHLNYDLSGQSGPQMERLKKRLSEVKHLDLTKRKDLNVMCDWVITLPENVPLKELRSFSRQHMIFVRAGTGRRMLYPHGYTWTKQPPYALLFRAGQKGRKWLRTAMCERGY